MWTSLRLGATAIICVLLAACPAQKTPADPGLAKEDFGCGIHLLLTAAEAAKLENPASGTQIRVLTPEELAQSDPYQTRDPQRDLLLAIVGQPPPSAHRRETETVTELRCYPADGSASQATLRGQRLRDLDVEAADRLFGTPGERTSSEGVNYLTYAFAFAPHARTRLELTLSFKPGAGCFAAKLKLVEPVRSFD